MNQKNKSRFLLMLGIILAAAVTRIIPHAPNFTPLAAIALFGGAHFAQKKWAFIVPLGAMLVSDIVLQFMFGWGFHAQMPAVYLSFISIILLGFWLKSRRQPTRIIMSSLTASSLFFIITNFSVWATGTMYAKSLSGLIACYVAATPFFGPTMAGDLFFTSILFAAFAYSEKRFSVFRLNLSA